MVIVYGDIAIVAVTINTINVVVTFFLSVLLPLLLRIFPAGASPRVEGSHWRDSRGVHHHLHGVRDGETLLYYDSNIDTNSIMTMLYYLYRYP